MVMLTVDEFDYDLPQELIAQAPVSPRDQARLMVVDRETETITHKRMADLPGMLTNQDVLVINRTKVFPARLWGTKETGGKVEILLVREEVGGVWQALSKPGLTKGMQITFGTTLTGMVTQENDEDGLLKIHFDVMGARFKRMLEEVGQVPIPPYIHSTLTEASLRHEYQTVYASEWGSAAAPTAGMHFTRQSLKKMADRGVGIVPLTLHVGLGTFQPLTERSMKTGKLHAEAYRITRQAAMQLLKAKNEGKRLVVVGTTSARALESAVRRIDGGLDLATEWQETDLFIKPPYAFSMVDSLVTNFHLPHSSLLMMVAAFMSQPNGGKNFTNFSESLIKRVYREAVKEHYRFYSFGDAMWIV